MHTGPLPGWNPPRTYVAALFNPLSLFAAGEQGAWYDPSDMATMFQESTATTPAALEQPVGYMLDKHLGLALGSEIVSVAADRDFSSDTGYWSKDPNVAIGSGTANWTAAVVNNALYRPGTLTQGKYYEVTFTVTSISAGSIAVYAGGNTGTARTAPGTYTQRVVCGTTNTTLGWVSQTNPTTASIDNVSWKEVTGNHVSQATAAARPTLSARYNRLIKTEKFNDAAWTTSGLTITVDDTTAPDGTVTADKVTCGLSDNVEYVSQGGAFTSTTGKFVCHVKPNSTTWCVLYLGSDAGNGIHHWYNLSGAGALGSTQLTGVGISLVTSSITAVANGFYRVSITVTGLSTMAAFCRPVVNGDATLNSTATHTAHIWGADVRTSADAALNIPVYQRVDTASSYDSVGFPQYLNFDGVDDLLDGVAGTYSGAANHLFVTGLQQVQNGNFQGPWRILRNGGVPTSATDNIKEEYTGNANTTRQVFYQRYPIALAMGDVDPQRPSPTGVHVSWNSLNNGVACRMGALWPGAGSKQDVNVGAVTITAAPDDNMLTIGKGYGAGNPMFGRLYGFIHLARLATGAEQAFAKAWMLEKCKQSTS